MQLHVPLHPYQLLQPPRTHAVALVQDLLLVKLLQQVESLLLIHECIFLELDLLPRQQRQTVPGSVLRCGTEKAVPVELLRCLRHLGEVTDPWQFHAVMAIHRRSWTQVQQCLPCLAHRRICARLAFDLMWHTDVREQLRLPTLIRLLLHLAQ